MRAQPAHSKHDQWRRLDEQIARHLLFEKSPGIREIVVGRHARPAEIVAVRHDPLVAQDRDRVGRESGRRRRGRGGAGALERRQRGGILDKVTLGGCHRPRAGDRRTERLGDRTARIDPGRHTVKRGPGLRLHLLDHSVFGVDPDRRAREGPPRQRQGRALPGHELPVAPALLALGKRVQP